MKKQIIELQRLLTAIPAINPESGGKGEWEKANALTDYLRDNGFPEPVHHDTPDPRVPEGTRPNITVRLEGKKRKPCIWVMTHIDIVPPGEKIDSDHWKGWNTNPYKLHVEGDLMFGRGVEDNQHSLVASVIAAQRLLNSNSRPPNDVALLFVSAEETGSEYGLKYLLDEHEDMFSKDDIIIAPDGGNEDGSMIEVAEKSVLWLNFHIEGKQTHASTPQFGSNSFLAMSEMVMELHRQLHDSFTDQDDIYRPSYSTFEPTRHDRNVPNANTISGEENFSFDCRVIPSHPLDEVIDKIHAIAGQIDKRYETKTGIEIENRLDAPPPTAHDAPAVKLLLEALKNCRGIKGRPLGLGGSTVAALFREKGYPAVVWSTIKGVAHQVNEHASISNISADADIYEYIFRNGSV